LILSSTRHPRRTDFGAHRRLTFLLRTSGFDDLPLSPRKPIPQHGVGGRWRKHGTVRVINAKQRVNGAAGTRATLLRRGYGVPGIDGQNREVRSNGAFRKSDIEGKAAMGSGE